MTNWYPTKENPYQGVFFKEQAFAMADHYDFIVIHCHESFCLLPVKKISLKKANTEKNTTEYDVKISVPLLLAVFDEIYNLYVKIRRINLLDGIGKYVSIWRRKYTDQLLTNLFRKEFMGKIDAFYCVDGQTEAYMLQCSAKAINKPYIISEHAPVPWPGTLISDINKIAIEQADLFFAISRDKIRQLMLQNIRLPKTVYIGNLIDESSLTLIEKEKKEYKTLLIVAAHSFYKNYDMFINVMDRLTEITDTFFKVMIVGYGANKGYSKGIEAFEEQINKSAFCDRVRMIPEVPHEHMNEIYHEADAFIMTSIQEGQPVSAMEAACCGLPIFSTRCGGVEDYVDDNIGRIYDINDIEGMAQGLKSYLEGNIVFEPMSIRKKVVKKFGTESFTSNFCNAFDTVIGNK